MTCRFRGEFGHVCQDRDGRTPPRATCWREAAAQLADLRADDLLREIVGELEVVDR